MTEGGKTRQTATVFDWATRPGEHLAEYAEINGWTTETMAARSGLSVASIAGILSGTRSLTPADAAGLATLTGLDRSVWLAIEARASAAGAAIPIP